MVVLFFLRGSVVSLVFFRKLIFKISLLLGLRSNNKVQGIVVPLFANSEHLEYCGPCALFTSDSFSTSFIGDRGLFLITWLIGAIFF